MLVIFPHMHNQLIFFFILKSCPGICKQNKDCAECFAFGTGLYNSSVCQRECTNVRTAAILEPASEYTEQCHSGIYATTTVISTSCAFLKILLRPRKKGKQKLMIDLFFLFVLHFLAPDGVEANETIKACITEDAEKCIINFNVCK